MNDSHDMYLCTMYDSYGVYLNILCTICMYKFSTCYTIIFHNFSIPMINFLDNLTGLLQYSPRNR
jgi:hypothetical protein